MIKMFLLKAFLCFILIISFCACASRQERISGIEAEIRRLQDSIDADTKAFVEPRLKERATLEDSLHTYLKPFEKRIAVVNEKALSTEKEFLKNLRAAKDKHFSRHGHDPDSQGSLNRIIDSLISQKEKKVAGYQAEINRIEESYKSDLFYLQSTNRIAVLDSELEGINNNISQRLKMKMKPLEDSLLLYAP